MPTHTTPIQKDNILFVQCCGHVSVQELSEVKDDTRISPDAQGHIVALVDLSGVTDTDLTFRKLHVVYEKLARYYEAKGKILRLVLFAPDDLTFGMTRIMQSLCADSDFVEVDIFRTAENIGLHLPNIRRSLQDFRALADSQAARMYG